MTNKPLQSLESLGPLPQHAGEIAAQQPARQDYLEGRKLFEQKEYAQAAIAFHNALRGFEEQGDRVGIANASDRLGDACLARGEYAMAIANFQRARAICLEEQDSFSQLSLHKKMAFAHRKLGAHAQALAIYDDMLEHYQLTKNPKGAVEVLEQIAEVHVERQDKVQAAAAYRAAANIHARFQHQRRAQELTKLAEDLG